MSVCYNRYPDEKGTESRIYVDETSVCGVTTVTPMKRGLKVNCDLSPLLQVTTVTPMKRGLKVSLSELVDNAYWIVQQLQPLPR